MMGSALDQSRARHVAIIMDGNGRWAKKRGLPRAVGHQRGVEAVRRLVRSLEGTGLECLTLYAFSSENWKRSEDEVDDLMNLMRRFIKSDLPEFVANDVKLKIIGDWQSLAPDIVAMLEDALAQTANGKQTLAVALNYGGQHEIARAAAKLAAKVGRTLPVIIDEVGEPDEDGDIGATGRSQADAPEIDGAVYLRSVPGSLKPGDIVEATIEDADAHDLFGVMV